MSDQGQRVLLTSGAGFIQSHLAEALLHSPRIMVFDEATSHLDSESEQLIQGALEKVALGRTVFVIAHRLSTIRHADKIVVVEDGEMVEAGRHDELLAREGVYHKLYTLQTGPRSSPSPAASGGIAND